MHFTADDYFFTDIHGCCPVFAHFDALMMMSLSFGSFAGGSKTPPFSATVSTVSGFQFNHRVYKSRRPTPWNDSKSWQLCVDDNVDNAQRKNPPSILYVSPSRWLFLSSHLGWRVFDAT